MKSYIIHLERAKARAPRVEYLSQALPGDVDIIDAVDGQTLSADELSAYTRRLYRPRYPFPLRQSEIACFHSHRKAWKMIADGPDDYAIVAEDDIMLDEAIFAKSYTFAAAHMTADSFTRFPVANHEVPSADRLSANNASLFTPKHIGLGMHLQMVGRNYASRLLAATEKFDRPVDTLLQMHWITKSVPVTILPSGVSEMDADIGGSNISQRKSIPQILWRETARPLYRSIIRLRPVS